MSTPSVANQRTYATPLAFTYPCYKDMYDNNIIFIYKGVVTADLVTNALGIMEERLEEDMQDKRVSKKVFNVMVECLANVYVDEEKTDRYRFDPTALLLIKKEEDAYCVITGHFIYNDKVQNLKKALDKINNMDQETLKSYYQEVLNAEQASTSGFTTLAMVDLSRKSKHKLIYQFKYITSEYTYFSLEARISKHSL